MSLVSEDVTSRIKDQLRLRLPPVLFDQWFAEAEVIALSESELELGVQNRFFKSRIESTYMQVLADAAEVAVGGRVIVSVSVSPRLFARFREEQERREEEAAGLELDPTPAFSAPREVVVRPRGPEGAELNPAFVFDNFVIGTGNYLSHAVAMRLVDGGGAFGLVYYCGQHGLGKTHLLQAICREMKEREPEASVVYITCERFVADFVAAHAAGRIKEFRAAYRDCDVLAIDQLQELGQGNKAATQTELLGILDALQARGKRVVVASTLAPGELQGVEARLRDRLGAGFVDRLMLPDEEMRRDLLSRKLGERGVELPATVLAMLARELSGNMRRLEGVVNRLAALLGMGGMEPTPACIRMALDVSTPGTKRSPVTVPDIVAAVAEEYGLSPEAVTGRGRAVLLRRARQVAVVLSRKLLGVRYAELGQVFGGRSHATIMSIMRKVEPTLFSSGVEGRGVERILFRLGVGIKPEELLERQRVLF